MLRFLAICASLSLTLQMVAQPTKLLTPFEKQADYSASYEEVIDYYKLLDQTYPNGKLIEAGDTDIGLPLHTFIIDYDQKFTPEAAKAAEKIIILVNNGIHPGEPCGIDASMMVARNILGDPVSAETYQDVVLVFIPVYNIGGALNRSPYSRVNQKGPAFYGFRGNAKNLDLNRDFVKCDSRNAQAFNRLFTAWSPEVFIDNHTSNGADYQHTLTLIATQKDKLIRTPGGYLEQFMLPGLYKGMQERGWDMCPYVYARSTPDEGIAGFLDLPRYSTGYAALYQTIGFMPETHMLKPFADRVRSVEAFMYTVFEWSAKDRRFIQVVREKGLAEVQSSDSLAINWEIDPTKVDSFFFKGYTAAYKPSLITGQDRLYYDQDQPYTKNIPLYNTYRVTQKVSRPQGYIIPQAYREVLDRLRWNGVQMEQITQDTTIEVQQYYIESYKSPETPYENHYLHRNVEVSTVERSWNYRKGDWYIPLGTDQDMYIIHVLEPQAPDSYFAWNFFDGVLMRKEGFSSYVFEDLAWEFLQENPEVAQALEAKKAEDPEFAKNARAQLFFIYERSPYYEPTHNLYPVARILKQ
ncbi:MAG: hypothetical protein AAGH79_08190 [Bacteroidota bacterium]